MDDPFRPPLLTGEDIDRLLPLIHWVGDAPTSLHGNGAASFERTTREAQAVTCTLCRTLLARPDHTDRSEG